MAFEVDSDAWEVAQDDFNWQRHGGTEAREALHEKLRGISATRCEKSSEKS
jgi:hypothetical protein